VVFWIFAVSAVVTQVMRVCGAGGGVFDTLSGVSAMWMAVMLYGFLAVAAIDLLRLAGWIGGIKPGLLHENYQLSKVILFGIVSLALIAISAWGYRNARYPRTTRLEVAVDKPAGDVKQLRVVLLSDLHLGHVTGRPFLARVVGAVNAEQPDIVLLAGDTFDGGPAPVIRRRQGAEFLQLQSTYGTFAATGNHEYIGRMEQDDAVEQAMACLAANGVTSLQDSAVLIAGSFYVVGRSDRELKTRKPVADLLAPLDKTLPVIVLDHQPYEFDKAEAAGVDLMLSGHTHHGQLWPFGHLTRRLFEQDWGYLRRGDTHFYVSCGTGTWGPAVRTSGYAEITVIDLTFMGGITK
jgi:predicted MPP superfamily phosphohydrolase